MAQMRSKGLQPPVAVDQVQEIVDPVVVDETDAVAYLIDQAERLHIDVTDEDVAHVVDAHLAYLAAIGAVGPVAEDDLEATVATPNCARTRHEWRASVALPRSGAIDAGHRSAPEPIEAKRRGWAGALPAHRDATRGIAERSE